jgi:hypothetical protein
MSANDLKEIRRHLESAEWEIGEAKDRAKRVGDKSGAQKLGKLCEDVKEAQKGFGIDKQ